MGDREGWMEAAKVVEREVERWKRTDEKRRKKQLRDNQEWRRRQAELRQRSARDLGLTDYAGEGLGRMSQGVGFFPGVFGLMFLGGVPEGGGEEEKRRTKQLQVVLRILAGAVFLFFVFV